MPQTVVKHSAQLFSDRRRSVLLKSGVDERAISPLSAGLLPAELLPAGLLPAGLLPVGSPPRLSAVGLSAKSFDSVCLES